MTAESAIEFLASLQPDDKLRLLAMLSHNLTIVARDTYGSEGGVAHPTRLRALNEVQHRTSASLTALTGALSHGGLPDDALVAMYFAERDDTALAALLAFAFERAAAMQKRREKADGSI